MGRRTRESWVIADKLTVHNDGAIAGGLTVGGPTDYLSIDSSGLLTLSGAATVWKDMVISVTAQRVGAVAEPDFAKIQDNGAGSTGIFAALFDKAAIEQVHFDREIPHDYKEGSDIFPHVHWMPTTTGTGVVVWGLEYAWANIGDPLPNTTLIYGSQAGAGVALTVQIVGLGTGGISGTGKTRSSTIVGRLFRFASDAADTYNADAVGLDIDFHYEIDRIGEDANPSA